jgi:hypothetical protein
MLSGSYNNLCLKKKFYFDLYNFFLFRLFVNQLKRNNIKIDYLF